MAYDDELTMFAAALNSRDFFQRVVMNNIAAACRVVRRAQWGAKSPTQPLERDSNYDSIVVHYTGRAHLSSMSAIQTFDVEHDHFTDVAYHYAVTPAGRIYEGRELIYKGSHVKLQNTGKIGIVCMGDFEPGLASWWEGHGWSGDAVQPPMVGAMRHLASVLRGNFPIITFGGHREYGFTDYCPGDTLLPVVQRMRAEFKLAAPTYRKL